LDCYETDGQYFGMFVPAENEKNPELPTRLFSYKMMQFKNLTAGCRQNSVKHHQCVQNEA